MRYCGNDSIFGDFVKGWLGRFAFSAYLKEKIGSPFLIIDGTDQVVASHVKGPTSDVVLLPHLEGNSTVPTVLEKFGKELLLLGERLAQRRKGEFALPEWASKRVLPGEQAIKALTHKAEEQEREVAEKKRQLIVQQIGYDRLKVMLSEKGDILHAVTIEVLRELGFTAREGPPGRDDIISDYIGRPLVAEVKGTKGSAAESHAAQLEKWVSNFKEEHTVTPKGMLVVNAFNDVPLEKRTQAPFPDQMLSYSTKRDHCLITSRQLLGLLFEVRKDPAAKDRLVQTLFDTVGVYKGFETFPV